MTETERALNAATAICQRSSVLWTTEDRLAAALALLNEALPYVASSHAQGHADLLLRMHRAIGGKP